MQVILHAVTHPTLNTEEDSTYCCLLKIYCLQSNIDAEERSADIAAEESARIAADNIQQKH